jgi:hypothetical protein
MQFQVSRKREKQFRGGKTRVFSVLSLERKKGETLHLEDE